jgi:hypothetical protein
LKENNNNKNIQTMTEKEKIKQEIERQIEEGKVKCQQSQENSDYESYIAWSEHVATCGKLLIFIDSLPEEPISEGLEEAADRYAFMDSQAYKGVHSTYCDDKIAFIAGAKWQKQQMMKHAVDGTKVFSGLGVKAKTGECVPYTEYKLCISDDLCNNCDRVKIIIIKDE